MNPEEVVACTCSSVDTIEGFIAVAIYVLFNVVLLGGAILWFRSNEIRQDFERHRNEKTKYAHKD